MNVEEIQWISTLSKREQWPYPVTFERLLVAGVLSYRTSIANNHTVYIGATSHYEETHAASAANFKVAALFQADAVKKGLQHHQKNQTPYSDFLSDMAKAGVQYYEVNMIKRTIDYTSGKPGESYVEDVPRSK